MVVAVEKVDSFKSICNRSSTDANAHLLYFNTQIPRQNIAIFAVQRLRAEDPSWTTANKPGMGVGFPTHNSIFPDLIAPTVDPA